MISEVWVDTDEAEPAIMAHIDFEDGDEEDIALAEAPQYVVDKNKKKHMLQDLEELINKKKEKTKNKRVSTLLCRTGCDAQGSMGPRACQSRRGWGRPGRRCWRDFGRRGSSDPAIFARAICLYHALQALDDSASEDNSSAKGGRASSSSGGGGGGGDAKRPKVSKDGKAKEKKAKGKEPAPKKVRSFSRTGLDQNAYKLRAGSGLEGGGTSRP